MKKSAQNGLPPLAADQWAQAALTGELIAVLSDEWLNLLKLGRLCDSLDQLRIRRGLPARSAYAADQFQGLLALHCVYYDAMSWATRAGLPAALLGAFGLDAHSGPVLLGAAGWQRLTDAYAKFAQACLPTPEPGKISAAGKSSAPHPAREVRSSAHKERVQEAVARALDSVRTAFASLREGVVATSGASNHDRAEVARSSPSHPALTQLQHGYAAAPECGNTGRIFPGCIQDSQSAPCSGCSRQR